MACDGGELRVIERGEQMGGVEHGSEKEGNGGGDKIEVDNSVAELHGEEDEGSEETEVAGEIDDEDE